MTKKEKSVLSYVIQSVIDDLTYDAYSDKYRDNGDMGISLSEEEYNTLINIKL